MSLLKSTSRIFTGYVSGKAQGIEFQCKLIAFLAAIAAPTAVLFSAINYFSGHIWLSFVELFTILLLIPCFKLRHQQELLPWCRNLLMSSAMIVFTSLFIDGGIANSGIIWSLLVPFMAFLLMGIATAWYWVISYALINALLIILHFIGFYTLPYSNISLAYFPAVFIFFSLIAAVFEIQLERLHRSHEATIDELETLRNDLETHVEHKTRALKQSNQQLQIETQEHEKTSKALQLSEEMFFHAQKMDAIGTLVGGIAHDFNNLLAGISGNVYLLKDKLKDHPDLYQRVSSIEKLCLKASTMISQLLAFARKDKVNLQYLPFTTLVEETMKLAMVTVPENIKVTQEIATTNMVVYGDSTQLQQVVFNLINNARDALNDTSSPEITITLETFTPDHTFRNQYKDKLLAEHYAHLNIQDNGCGIRHEKLQRIFEPFFTTKKQGKGTGLGLAMVFGSIQTHDGIIDVESMVDCGSTFHIYLPLQKEQETIEINAPSPQETLMGNGETILFVDDDCQLRSTIGEVLENMGYRVLLAADGVEAISLYAKHQEQIALTILDLVMPKMGGKNAAKKIHSLNPAARILFATGYDKDNHSERANNRSSSTTIKKPFVIESLSRTIASSLLS